MRNWKSILAELSDLRLFVHLALSGMRYGEEALDHIQIQREAARVLGDPDPYQDADALAHATKHAEDVASFAKQQAERGFSYLFGLAAVQLWTSLETMVDDLAAQRMSGPHMINNELLRSLKGPLLEFAAASDDDRSEFLLEQLKVTVKAALRPGIGRFEAVLQPVGLAGEVDDALRRSLYELSQIRNIVVHQRGIADRRLVTNCPWLKAEIGRSIKVDQAAFELYIAAVEAYVFLIDLRLRNAVGEEDTESSKSLRETLIRRHAELAASRRGGA